MFSTNKNIQTLEELVIELKRYFRLQKKFVALEFVSKLIILLSALVLGMVLFLIGAIVIILFAMFVASLVGDIVGSLTIGYAIVSAFFALMAIVVYLNRKRLITQPITNFLCDLFLKKK